MAFQELYEILQSFGLDVNSMLVRIPEEEWPKVVKEGTQDLEQEYKGSDEIWLLYRTYLAMVGLNSDDSNTVLNSMLTIDRNRTSYCNDALIPLIQNGSLEVKMKAIRLIEKTLDFSKIDLLCSLLSGTPLRMRNAVIRAISTIESAHNFLKLAPPPRSKPHIDTYPQNPELIESYIAALNKLTKSSSSIARIDAVKALSAIKLPDVENHLRQLMNDEDPKVRLAVLNACVNLPKDKVVDILRLGIQDIEPFVEKEALRLFEERWPDSYW